MLNIKCEHSTLSRHHVFITILVENGRLEVPVGSVFCLVSLKCCKNSFSSLEYSSASQCGQENNED